MTNILGIAATVLALVPAPKEQAWREGTCAYVEADVRYVRDAALPPEGYRLEVTPGGVTVASADDAGAFYARKTLKQLAAGDGGRAGARPSRGASGTREHAEVEISVRCARKGGFESVENLLRNKFKRDLRCLRKGEAVLLDETQTYLVAFRERMRRAWPDRKVDFYHLNSSTDARHLQRLNLPMLILGVDARGAHTATEYVEIPSLDEYAVLIESYLMDEFGN